MHVIDDAIGPGSRVIQEADPDVGTSVVMVAGLDDLRAILLQCVQGFFRRTNDRNVPRHVFVRILEQDQHEVSLVCQPLGFSHI